MGLLGGSQVVLQVVLVCSMVKVTVLFGGPGQQVAQVPGLEMGPEVWMLVRVQLPWIGGAWARVRGRRARSGRRVVSIFVVGPFVMVLGEFGVWRLWIRV